MKSKIKYLFFVAVVLCTMFAVSAPVSADTATDVRVGGIWLEDGQYLESGTQNVTTTKPASGGYAFFDDGILVLKNFEYEDTTYDNYNGVYCDGDLEIFMYGYNNFFTNKTGIHVEGDLYISSESMDYGITIQSNYYGIYAAGNIDIHNTYLSMNAKYNGVFSDGNATIESSDIYIEAMTDDCVSGEYVSVESSWMDLTSGDDGISAGDMYIYDSIVYTYGNYGLFGVLGVGEGNVIIESSEMYLEAEYNAVLAEGYLDIYDSIVYAQIEDDDDCAFYVVGDFIIDSDLTVRAAKDYSSPLEVLDETQLYEYKYIVIGYCLDTPTNVKVNNVASSGKPKVTWNTVDGAVKYYVYRATSKNGTYSYLGSTTNTHYTNTGAKAGTTYYYKVKAVSEDSEAFNSALSSYCYITCDLAQPSNVKVNPVASSGKPKVTWNAVDGAVKYYVYRSTSKNGTYSYLGSTTNTHYTNTGAKAGTTYYYKVKAVISESSAANSAQSSYCYMTCDLAKPTGVKVALSSGKPKVSWTAVSGADKYYVYRATSANGTYSYLGSTTKTSYTNTGAKAGTKYYYKVKAVDSDKSAANSAQSSYVSITSK